MYRPPNVNENQANRWIQYFTSAENRHALPLFTSLLNTVCAYDRESCDIYVVFN